MNIEAFWSALTGNGVVALVLGFWAKYYFGPYLKLKATNLATHEDIQLLINQVRETERVKADISDLFGTVSSDGRTSETFIGSYLRPLPMSMSNKCLCSSTKRPEKKGGRPRPNTSLIGNS
jgi:hypothetical protein